MKYSVPKLRGLGGSSGSCVDGSSATNASTGLNECSPGIGNNGICVTGSDVGPLPCSSGVGNAHYCGFGSDAGYPASCVQGYTFGFNPCEGGSAPGS